MQQFFSNAQPFRIKRSGEHRLGRPLVPISRVAVIAFLAMEIGMNPRPVAALDLLSRFVAACPFALSVPP